MKRTVPNKIPIPLLSTFVLLGFVAVAGWIGSATGWGDADTPAPDRDSVRQGPVGGSGSSGGAAGTFVSSGSGGAGGGATGTGGSKGGSGGLGQ